MVTRPQLYHFTCPHGLAAIERDGWVLRPQGTWRSHALGVPTGLASAPPVLWLTDDPTPTREAVGLTSVQLTCDRMAYRLALPPGTPAWRWHAWALARGATYTYQRMLAQGREHWRWHVTEHPVQLDAATAEQELTRAED